MASSRVLLSILLLTGAASSALLACGDDDGTNAVPDASTAIDAARDDIDAGPADAGAVEAVASGLTVYLGAAVKLDATASTGPVGFTYAWALATAPAGSAVTTASLADATTATPAFAPDRPGAYALTLTVASGSVTSTIPVTVTAVDPTVFYLETESSSGVNRAGVKAVGALSGDGGVPVACSVNDAGVSYSSSSSYSAQFGADTWEGPAGTASRIAYVAAVAPAGGGTATTALHATTSTATCASAPVVLDSFAGDPVNTRPFEQPRFSPSGNRIAYVKNADTGSTVTTVGFDGAQARNIGAFYANGDGTPNPTKRTPNSGSTVRAAWLDETHVAWLATIDTGWKIVSAPDQAGGEQKVLMTCSGAAPAQFDVLANGDIIVAPKTGLDPALPSANIVRYTADPTTKACGAPTNVTGLTANGEYAAYMALSPDRTRIAYTAFANGNASTRITNVDGTGTIVLPAGTHPRWVGEGREIAFSTNAKSVFDAGSTGTSTSAVAVAHADGGALHMASFSEPGTALTIGSGYAQFCSMGRAFGPGVTFFGMLGIAGLRLARRRKR